MQWLERRVVELEAGAGLQPTVQPSEPVAFAGGQAAAAQGQQQARQDEQEPLALDPLRQSSSHYLLSSTSSAAAALEQVRRVGLDPRAQPGTAGAAAEQHPSAQPAAAAAGGTDTDRAASLSGLPSAEEVLAMAVHLQPNAPPAMLGGPVLGQALSGANGSSGADRPLDGLAAMARELAPAEPAGPPVPQRQQPERQASGGEQSSAGVPSRGGNLHEQEQQPAQEQQVIANGIVDATAQDMPTAKRQKIGANIDH